MEGQGKREAKAAEQDFFWLFVTALL